MRYVSLTPDEKKEMLQTLGLQTAAELFQSIPEALLLKRPLNLPEAVPETVLLNYFRKLGRKNASADRFAYFLGAGAYHHFIPTIIDAIISRAEYYTAYTPYQPEVSQGTLQAIFEYQTLICQLTAMEVSNASLYDGASALAEAILMAARVTRRTRVLLPTSLHPEYRQVAATYVSNLDFQLEDLPYDASGAIDLNAAQEQIDEGHAAVVVQSPNFFGVIEEIGPLAELAHRRGALLIAVIPEGMSLGILKPPGESGADIVAGEGQSFGLPLGFGGPYLGFFATRDEYKRQMPGRLVGETVDHQNRRGFVLTLTTREQHIRREKATSNICTNQGLCALIAAIFLATLGKAGLRELAAQNLKKAHYLRKRLQDQLVFSGPVFNEMVVRCPESPEELNRLLYDQGIIGGLPLGGYFPDRAGQMLVCVTEQNTREDMEKLIAVFNSVEVAS